MWQDQYFHIQFSMYALMSVKCYLIYCTNKLYTYIDKSTFVFKLHLQLELFYHVYLFYIKISGNCILVLTFVFILYLPDKEEQLEV